MAFSDPQTLTINAVPNTLPRTGSGPNQGIFTKDDGLVRLSLTQAQGKRRRHTVRVDFSKIAPDPFTSGANNLYSMSAYLVVDRPLSGFTLAEAKQPTDALVAYLTASSGARLTQLLGGEL